MLVRPRPLRSDLREGGVDYPLDSCDGRGRNFEAVLIFLRGALAPSILISHRFPFERAPDAYDLGEHSLGIARV